MKVDFAFICDFAEATGKINALGIGFDTIYAPKVPYKHPTFSFVLQLRAGAMEAGQKKLDVHLLDEDGKDVIPVVSRGIQMRKPITGAEIIARVALNFGNVQFSRYGSYSIRAALDGDEIVSVSLNVSPPPKPLPGSRSPSVN